MAEESRLWDLLLGQAGTLVLALLVIVGFLRGYIVPGWAYRALERERDRLFRIAVPAVGALERGADAVRHMRTAEPDPWGG